MRHIALFIFLAALAAPALAEEVMIPGTPYAAAVPMSQPSRVTFLDDGNILLEDAGRDPRLEGRWQRRKGEFCIHEDPEFAPLCLIEAPLGTDGSFSLSRAGKAMEFHPLPD